MLLLTIMVNKSANQMQSKGYRLNVEDSKYLIFETKDHAQKIKDLEIMVHNFIDFCEFSKNNQEKQDEICSRMLAMETYLESLPFIKIKVCDDEFEFDTQDIDDFEDIFGLEFPTLNYYFRIIHIGEILMFRRFYKTLKSDDLKEKFKDLYKAVDQVIHIEFDRQTNKFSLILFS